MCCCLLCAGKIYPPKTTLLLCVIRMPSFVFPAHLLVEHPGIGGDGVLQSLSSSSSFFLSFFLSLLFHLFKSFFFLFFSHTESLQSGTECCSLSLLLLPLFFLYLFFYLFKSFSFFHTQNLCNRITVELVEPGCVCMS